MILHLQNARTIGILAMISGLFLSVPGPAALWLNNYPLAMKSALETGKPVLVYFCDPEAPSCKKFEGEVLSVPEIARLLDHYVLVRIHPKWNESLAAEKGIYRLPAIVIQDSAGKQLYKEQKSLTDEGLFQALSTYSLAQSSPNEVENPTPKTTEPPSGSSSSGQVSLKGVTVYLVRSATQGKEIAIRAQAPDPSFNLQLHYRVPAQRDYESVKMQPVEGKKDLWQAIIPSRAVVPGNIEYFISGNREGSILSFPINFAQKPFVIEVR